MSPIYEYIANRSNQEAVKYILEDCDMKHLLSSIINDLRRRPLDWGCCLKAICQILSAHMHQAHSTALQNFINQLFTFLRGDDRLATDCCYPSLLAVVNMAMLSSLRSTLAETCRANDYFSHDNLDVFALRASQAKLNDISQHALLADFPTMIVAEEPSAADLRNTHQALKHRLDDRRVAVMATFLSACSEENLPLNARQTSQILREWISFGYGVCPETLRIFADCVRNLVQHLNSISN